MIEKFRNSLQSGFTYVLVAGLTVIFMFFFGMPSQTCSGAAGRQNVPLAQVAGTSIQSDDLNILYNRVWGADRTDDDKQYRQQQARALKNLILIEMFADRARKAGLRVSTKELKKYIKDPARNFEYRFRYGSDGSFNGRYYKAYVENQLRTRVETYEQFKRKELLARKYLASHAAQAAVPKPELERAREIKNTKLNLAFVRLAPDAIQSGIEVSSADVQSFLSEQRDRVQKYYKNNKSDEYSTPARVKIRRVYIERPGSSGDKSKSVEAKQKWKEAKKRVLQGGESVETVAAELGEQIAGQEKGLMGWSKLENLADDIKKAVDEAEVGDVKKVTTDHAYMLVKLEDREKAKTTPLKEVEGEIAKKLLRRDRSEKLVSEVEKKLHEKATSEGSLQKALESLQNTSDDEVWNALSVEKTGEFTLEAKGPPPQVAAQMGGRLPPGLGGKWFKIPEIGASKKLAVTAFKELTEKKPVADSVFEVGGSKYVVELASRTEPDSASDSGPEPSVEFQLETRKVSELVGRWPMLFGNWGRWSAAMGRLAQRPAPPMKEYGPWLERQLKNAIDEGSVKLYGDRSKVAGIVENTLKPGGETPAGAPTKGGPAAGKKKKGSPIELKMGGKKGKKKGSPIKLKMGGKKGKSQKLNLKKALEKAREQKKQKKGSTEGAGGGGESGNQESGGTEK